MSAVILRLVKSVSFTHSALHSPLCFLTTPELCAICGDLVDEDCDRYSGHAYSIGENHGKLLRWQSKCRPPRPRGCDGKTLLQPLSWQSKRRKNESKTKRSCEQMRTHPPIILLVTFETQKPTFPLYTIRTATYPTNNSFSQNLAPPLK